jgi:hypothetical protein
MPPPKTVRRNAEPDADGEAPLGHRDYLAGVAGHISGSYFVPNRRSHACAIVSSLGWSAWLGYGRNMCGSVRLSSDVSEIKLVFSIPPHRPTPNFPPSWNVAPTDSPPVVRYDVKAGERSLDMLRRGLVPFWAKDLKVGFANINAKAEGIETRPAFREAFQRRRCLVQVDSFYE